jgi:mannose-1-phosphate guanylyltransferase
MATLLKALINRADYQIGGGVALRLRTQGRRRRSDVMLGVEPPRLATEYGYIRTGPSIGHGQFAIERFVEKPDSATAARYLAEGYLWNSGNFMFRARSAQAK